MTRNQDLQLLIAVYPTEDGADRGLDKLRRVAGAGILHITETAILTREKASGAVRLTEGGTGVDPEQTQTGAAKTMSGIVFPSSLLISDLIASFVGTALGVAADRGRQRESLIRAGRRLRRGTSALAVLVEDHVVTRLKAGARGRYELLDCTADAEEVAAFEIRLRT
jgi:uncharacterized membrane protein